MSIIEVEGLHKRYGGTVAAEDVSLAVEEGEIFGILGPNGAGKTTIVECVEGLRRPDRGTVRVAGLDPQRDRSKLRQLLGAQLQEAQLPEKLRVGEALALYRSFYRDGADCERLLADLGLAHRRDTAFEDLSGGEQQRLSVALALVGNPRVAVLDELTTGLDPQGRRDTWRLIEHIRDSGVTIVLVTHFMEEAERLCDRIAVIDDGRVVATDTPAGLIARVNSEQRIRFRPSDEIDQAILAGLPEVRSVTVDGRHITVTGDGNLLHAVSSALVRADVTATEMHLDRASLDDAFLTLTGHLHDGIEEVTR